MPRSKGPNSVQTCVSVPESWLERLDALARSLVREHPGLNVVRADAHRAALGLGMQQLEAKYRLGPPVATPSKVPGGFATPTQGPVILGIDHTKCAGVYPTTRDGRCQGCGWSPHKSLGPNKVPPGHVWSPEHPSRHPPAKPKRKKRAERE